MSNQNKNFPKSMQDSHYTHLKKLRDYVTDALRYAENFWLVYRDNTYGMAGFIDLRYKKSFIEIIFFTPEVAKTQHNGKHIEIHSPVLNELSLFRVIDSPVLDDEGMVIPVEVFKLIEKIVDANIQGYLYLLNNQVSSLNSNYENYPIEDNPYNRVIYIYSSLTEESLELSLKLKRLFRFEIYINFVMFPRMPVVRIEAETLPKPFRTKFKALNSQLDQLDVFKDWDEFNPASIEFIVDRICDFVFKSFHLEPWNAENQKFMVKNLEIDKDLPLISFELHRGQSLGIIYSKEILQNLNQTSYQGQTDEKAGSKSNEILYLFRQIMGIKTVPGLSPNSSIFLFGMNIKSHRSKSINDDDNNSLQMLKSIRNSLFILDSTIEPALMNLKVKRAIKKGIQIRSKVEKIRTNRKLVRLALEITGLANHMDDILGELTTFDRLKFRIARALLQDPQIIMLSFSTKLLDRMGIKPFKQMIKRITKTFHTIILLHSAREIVSDCDQILTISENSVDSGPVDELVLKIPQSGEVISVELNLADESVLSKMLSLTGAYFIEERKNEKYKIFSKEDPDSLVIRLLDLVGPYLYRLRRKRPDLEDYLEFKELIEKND
ncbi:MAG: hypothetical protein ACTSU2_05620 [Promethearchaeota archaeon]